MPTRPGATAANLRRACACALLALGAATAFADPADYVFTPYTDLGRWQLAYGLGTERDRDGGRETQQTLGIGGAPGARWYTSAYAAWAADRGGHFQADEWSWTNHLQLTSPGTGRVDAGMLCELARPHDRDEGRLGATCGPTLQMDTDDLQVNFNALLQKQFGAREAGRPGLGYQWQIKRLVARGVELGAQGFGSLGDWNRWAPVSQQEHIAGPALFLKTNAPGGPLRVDAAWLFGVGGEAVRGVLRVRVQEGF